MHYPATFKTDLIDWFKENQRQMPWRETTDPYKIWVSEVMLQQTQVDTVRDYYMRFIERFPTVKALAEAPENEVLKYWEGLGYYSRARNFHTAAKEVVLNYKGIVPIDPTIFKTLKGVGPYTQAAVMSIAFNHPLPTVDGNVFRVWSRLNNDDTDIALQSTRKRYEHELLPYVETESGTFNQAMMELGALICTPKSPLCIFCPVQTHCESYELGTVLELPVKKKKIKKKVLHYNVYLIENESGAYLIEQRNEKLLNNMWQFPMVLEDENTTSLKSKFGPSLKINETKSGVIKHHFTHMTWVLNVYKASIASHDVNIQDTPTQWLGPNERHHYTFPVSMSKIYETFCKRNAQ
ncbi:A/G-specific adenine glycosylase [Staphylococcus agnetis]|uniref:A/G-specific adenine glycosylase n=1 Tax=Staphylococcus agnetis TaxID=985762 RepID=UPI000E057989|nr:A/G-specific adenine glycosylase [Staphylococcus agnetis]SUK12733.1 A/G-specific adenine glycosylase [Staphylococcus agnetis]